MSSGTSQGRPTVRRTRTVALAAAVVAAIAAGGCAEEASGPDVAIGDDTTTDGDVGANVGEFAATTDYLVSVADATEGQTYRIAVDMAMQMGGQGTSFDVDGRLMTGEVDGDRTSMTMDLGVLFDDMADQLPAGEAPADMFGDDLTMDMVTDGTTMYLRAPFFAALAGTAGSAGASPGDLGPLTELAELGDGWGRVDMAQVSPSAVASAAGAQTVDPEVYLAIVSRGDDVRDLGADSIDGVEVRGLGATVTYEDMVAAQGMDIDDALGQVPADASGAVEALRSMEMPIEVWVDGDDRLRRISFAFDMADMVADLDVAERPPADFAMAFDMTMTLSDYDDPSIDIEVPEASVDLTEAFLELSELEGVGGSPAGSPFGNA
jgi:hypothetical protein